MSEFKGTPGPWRAVEHGEPGSGWWSVLSGAWDVSHNHAAEPGVVADSRYSAMKPAENAANAHLIAAAPEMLAALKVADEFIRNGALLGYIRMPAPDTPDPAQEVPEIIRAAIAKATGGGSHE